MAKSISSLLIEDLGLFNALVVRSGLNDHVVEVPTSLWTDELGRLRVWAANIGAHQTGQSSLDYRLRDASHIKDQVIRLLETLRRSLTDLQDALSEPPVEVHNESSDDEDTTEFEQIYNGLVELINSLFQMSMLIRRPARHDRFLGTSKEDYVPFEPYDRKHVHEKYPGADELVVDRLGTAISRRRADLRYRERHRAKLSQGINKLRSGALDESQSIHDRESTLFSDTIATEFKEPNIQFDETGSNSGISQTSYAPTLLEGGRAITVPHPPKESANEQPFECPYCFFITTIKNKRSWARHVFRDILPYVCIFADCSTPNRLYDSRREWYQHISTTHLAALTDRMHECPLCQAGGLSASSFESHLGRHLEELALFAVPRPITDEDVESDRSKHSIEEGLPADVSSEEELEVVGKVAMGPLAQSPRERHLTLLQQTMESAPLPGEVAGNANLFGLRRDTLSFEDSRTDRPVTRIGLSRQREEEELQIAVGPSKHREHLIEDRGRFSSLLASPSVSTQGDSGPSGGEKSQGAWADWRKFFGLGQRTGAIESKDAASGEASSRTGT